MCGIILATHPNSDLINDTEWIAFMRHCVKYAFSTNVNLRALKLTLLRVQSYY